MSANPYAQAARDREAQRPRRGRSTPIPRPRPENVIDHGRRYGIAQKAQALTLLSLNWPAKQVSDTTGIEIRTLYRIKNIAFERGYRPEQDCRILDHYVMEGRSTGRPKEITKEVEERLLDNVKMDRNSREKSSEVLAYETGISASSALSILHKYDMSSVKPTRKPGLNATQRAARLKFCLDHKDWTLDDWKRVIWSDETSVILGQRRGAIRLWRSSEEAYDKTVIRRRWKGFTEFMFWGSFCWDSKGPCHIYRQETAKDKKKADEEIQALNSEREQKCKDEWFMSSGIKRLALNGNLRGRKPTWRYTEKTGLLVRRGNGGIDWYRYWKVICQCLFCV
jgi:Transposase